jgi:hypothetical protein
MTNKLELGIVLGSALSISVNFYQERKVSSPKEREGEGRKTGGDKLR